MANRVGWYLPEQLILKITLAQSAPAIWRRVEVHSGLTLHELHYVIQSVFMWTNSHLYQFFVPPGGKLTQPAMRSATRYHTLPKDGFSNDDEGNDRRSDEVIVGQILNQTRKQIVYEYDFGDSWNHLIKVEKRSPGGTQDHVPRCLAGENAAPLDDVGGMYGFYDMIEAIRDKKHEMHEPAVESLGPDFDPTHFDLDAANRRLKSTFKPLPKKPRKPRKKKG